MKQKEKNGWTNIILEAFCMRRISLKKDRFVYEIISLKPFKTRKIPNRYYAPSYRIPRKPNYCPDIPQYCCLEKKCPHLAYANADKEFYSWLDKKYYPKYEMRNSKKSVETFL